MEIKQSWLVFASFALTKGPLQISSASEVREP